MIDVTIKYFEVVKVLELMPIIMEKGDDLKFRIEILKDSSTGECHANLWRVENYRIQPSFPQKDGLPSASNADEEIFVKDVSTLSGIKNSDANEALQIALATIQNKFT